MVALAGVVLALSAAPAQAACDGIPVTLSDVAVATGQTAEVEITASGVPEPGIAGFGLTLTYDTGALTVLAATAGPGFSNSAANVGQPGTVALAAADATGLTGDPLLGTLEVRAGSTPGASAIAVSGASLVDADLHPIAACPAGGTVTVTQTAAPLQVTATALVDGTVGSPYDASLAATGGTGPYRWSVVKGSLPAGLSLDPLTGAISGTPTAAGSATFVVEVTDRDGNTASGAPPLLIAPASPTLAIATTSLPGASVDVPYATTLVATGGTAPDTWSVAGSLPAGLSLHGGGITGTPTTAEATTFTLTVTDSSKPARTASLPLAIVVAPAGVTVASTDTATATSAATPVTATVSSTSDAGGQEQTLTTTATATGGTGTVTTSRYAGNPEASATPAFQAGAGTFFDVDVAPESTFGTLVIEQCGLSSAQTLFWWNGSAWASVAPQSYASGCVQATLAVTGTSPTIAELTGTPFVAAPVITAPTTLYIPPLAAPVIGGVSPTGGAAGTVVTITGSNFAAPLTVRFGTAPATAARLDSAGQLVVAVPAGTGTVAVTITTAAGTSAENTAARFTYPAPATGAAPPAAAFPDVPASFWAAQAIGTLTGRGIVSGLPGGLFEPDLPVTRAAFVKMLVLTLGLQPRAGATDFADVHPGDWFAPYVGAALQAGLVQGTGATTFSPNAPLTRQELAVVLQRAVGGSGTATLTYADAASISAWARGGVEAAVAAGTMTGFPDGTFRPLTATTRAQAAQVLARVLAGRG